MKLPITKKILIDWAGYRVYREGRNLFDNKVVQRVEYEHPFVRGELSSGNKAIDCQFELLSDRSIDNQCPCRDNRERGIVCAHVIALALELIRRRTDPHRAQKAMEEKRRAVRLADMDESKYLKRVAADDPGAMPAELRIVLADAWQDQFKTGHVDVQCLARIDERLLPLDAVPTNIPLAFNQQDENILFVLEDICGGPARGRLNVAPPDFINLLNLHAGKPFFREKDSTPITVNTAKMHSTVKMDLDLATGELNLRLHTELPFTAEDQPPVYILGNKSGWVYAAEHFWPLAIVLPGPLRAIYQGAIRVGREAVPRFLEAELPLLQQHLRVESDITRDLFTIEPAEPRFRLVVKGSPASLAATLYAEYGKLALIAGKAEATGHFAAPDPNDIMRYLVRNPTEEARALEVCAAAGWQGDRGDRLSPVVGSREVLNHLGSRLPKLRRRGWKIELEGRVAPFMESLDFITPVVRIHDHSSEWFEVGFEYENGGGKCLAAADIQRALLKGESFISQNGRTILFDTDAIQTAQAVFADCASDEGRGAGTFRLANIHAPYVKSSLDALDGIDVESPSSWTIQAERYNRSRSIAEVALSSALEDTLRPYQKEGIYWLHFLEQHRFCGILADEMGLGKTLQTLAWLQLQRVDPAFRDRPALIVCPTSLVENWAEEATRFVPGLSVLILSGGERHQKWDEIERMDIVVTSYALMRRDIDHHLQFEYAVIILDEAQHIKNKSTQNALAAKKLRGANRLVLTGTPIENSVSDLWSIMDFLMPGYLGPHRLFKEHYETPIARNTEDGAIAQIKLRRKLHPFLMRRLKKDVAKDLPPKIERIASCTLSRDQQRVYQALLESTRREINAMVEQEGFNQSRMKILTLLLRLRQTCCHLDLLKLPDLDSETPSAKMDLFFELLDEAMDGGHRVLVFSQFTTMLGIIRAALEQRGLPHCYLDGSTKERLRIVKTFNTDREIPVFLISLKAGGTGLNLTGADMVIHFDPWWNPAVEDQATDRVYRIGQQRTVYSVKLIAKGTVEEKVLAMQKRKKKIIDATLLKDEQIMQKLTWEDVRELLAL